MPDKLSYNEFASKIKAKYPQYESLDNAVLVKKMVDKYPQYNESVDTIGMPGITTPPVEVDSEVTPQETTKTENVVAPEIKEQPVKEVSREKESLLAGISSLEEKKVISSAFDRTDEYFANMGGITPYQKIQNFNTQLDGLNKKYDPKSFANMTKEGLDKLETQYKQDARQIAVELGLNVDNAGNVSLPPNEVELFKRKMGDNISFAENEGKKEVGFLENLASSLASGYERASGAALDLAGTITGLNYFDSYKDLAEGNRYNAETFKQQATKYDQTIQDYIGQGDLTKATGLAITGAVESLPYMIPALVNPEYGVFVMGGMSGIDKYRELDEKKIPEWEKVYNAISTGAFEAIFEKVGTGAILARSKRAMLEMGEKQGKEAIINATTKTIENGASKLGRMPEWAKEGFSEVATGIGQDITDKVTVNPDVVIGSSAVDNFVVGAVMGKAFALPQDVARFAERKQARDFAKNVLDKLPSDMDIETKINLGWKIAERDKLQEAEDKLDPKFKGKYETQLVTLNTQIDQVANDYLGRAKVEEVPDLSVGKIDEIGDEQSKLDYLKGKGVSVPNGANMDELNSLYDTEKSKEIETDKKVEIEAIEKKRQEDLAAAEAKKEITPEQKKKDEINEKADAEVEKVENRQPISSDIASKENRMTAIEDEILTEKKNPNPDQTKLSVLNSEFDKLENETEKQEWESVFNIPLSDAKSAIDDLIKKKKEMPNGYGAFIESKDARESKEVTDRYADPSLLTDIQILGDFKNALFGNPTTWYADGLKLRESIKEANRRGISTDRLIKNVENEFTKDDYSEETARRTIAGMIKPIMEGASEVKDSNSLTSKIIQDENNAEVSQSNEGKKENVQVQIENGQGNGLRDGNENAQENVQIKSDLPSVETVTKPVEETQPTSAKTKEAIVEPQNIEVPIKEKSATIKPEPITDESLKTVKKGDWLGSGASKKLEVIDVRDNKIYTPEGWFDAGGDGSAGRVKNYGKGSTVILRKGVDYISDITIESRANALADAIQDKRFYKSMDEMMNLKSDFGGIELIKTAWDGSLNIASEVVRAGGKVAQAISDSIEYLKGTDWYKGLSDPSKKIAEQKLREEIKGRTEDAKQIRAEAKLRIKQEKLDAKKTRMKLPSENPVKEVTLSEAAGLKDQLRREVKAAMESARATKKSFRDLGKEVKGKFKDAYDKGFVTGGQYRSIINRLSTATTEKTQKGLMDYVDRVLDDATYTKEVGIAKKLIKNIQKSNKKGKTKFGDWRVIADEIGRVKAKNMTIEELVEFNKIAAEILAGETVNIPALDKVYEITKEYHLFTAKNDPNVARIEKAPTLSSINTAIYALEEMASSTTTMVGYLKMKHAIDSAAKRAGELFDAGEITQEELDTFNAQLYKNSAGVEGAAKGFEEQLKDIKERILTRIDSERRFVDKDMYSGFLPDTQKLIKGILGAKRADISTLDAKDIDSYLQFIRNLNESAFVPESASLGIKLDKAKIRRTTTDRAASIYSKSKRFAEAVRLKFTNPLQKKLDENSILKSLSNKTKSEEFHLTRALRSFSDVSMESFLGNFDYANGYTALSAAVGRAFNQSNTFRKTMEDKAVRIVSDFAKIKGTAKQKRREKQSFAMFMAERRFQANKVEGQPETSFMDFVYREKSGDIKPKMNDQGAFSDNQKVYESLFGKAKSLGAVKEYDGREIIDAEKLETELRKDPRWKKAIEETDNWFSEMEGKVEVSTMMNGRTYIKEKKYFPLIQQGMSTFLDTESMKNLVDFNSTGIKMQAGATFAANKIKQQIELDPLTIMHSHLSEITRNYYIFPKLKAAVDAIKASSLAQAELNRKENKDSGKGDYDGHAEMLGRAFQKSLVSRAAFNLNGRRQTEYSVAGRWFDKMLSAKKKGLLADPTRVPAEFMANSIRASISSSFVSNDYEKYQEAYKQMIDEWIGEKHFSKMADDLSEAKFKGWLSSKAEAGAIGVITYSDTFIGRIVYAVEFNQKFKELTGEEFNPKLMSNEDYESENEEAIEKANITALRRTEELFNSKNIMSTPELTRFLGGFIKADAGKIQTKIFDSLQGYNRNENEHMIRSARKMKYGNDYEKSQAKKDFWAIPLSNFTYMAVRSASTIVVTHLINALIGRDDDDKLRKRMDEVFDPAVNASKFASSLVSLSWGGSSNIYSLALKGGMYVLDDSKLVNEEGMAKIYEWAQDDLYVSGFKEYTSTKSALTSATPGVTPIKDAWEFGEAWAALIRAAVAASESGYISNEEYLKIINGMNIAVTYGYPNAFSGIIQKQMAPMIRDAVKANKASAGDSGEEIDYTNQAEELLNDYEEFQKQEIDFE